MLYSFVGLSGGQIFHEMMLRHDVKQVFGYPGGAILPVFDAIHNSPHFDFVLPRHEQGAGHMAEGYARVTGKPGVVLVTSGPGATNVITPMQDALSDGIPMVVFCGQVATSLVGSDAFQEADVVGISRSCTKWNVMVKDIAELPRRINEAFKIATSGRPGPVLVDLPKDVTAAILRTPIPAKAVTPGATPGLPQNPLHPTVGNKQPGDASLITKAADMINRAKRPIIYAGNGVMADPEGPELLKKLADIGGIPVTTTLQGLGAFDERDEKSLHMIGMHGAAYANYAIQEADVVIALGARFDDRVTGKVDTFAPAARQAALEGTGGIIHFEIQAKNVNKIIEAQLPVLGDVVASLAELVPQIKNVDRSAWLNRCKANKEKYPFTFSPSQEGQRLKPQEVMKELNAQAEVIGSEYRKENGLDVERDQKIVPLLHLACGILLFLLLSSFLSSIVQVTDKCRGEVHPEYRSWTAPGKYPWRRDCGGGACTLPPPRRECGGCTRTWRPPPTPVPPLLSFTRLTVCRCGHASTGATLPQGASSRPAVSVP